MIRVFVLSLFYAAFSVQADKLEDARTCMEITSHMRTYMDCCEMEFDEEMNPLGKHIKDGKLTCEEVEQDFERIGLMVNGEISEEGFEKTHKVLKDLNPDSEAALDNIHKACAKGQYEHKFPDDICVVLKQKTCFVANVMTMCPKWKDGDKCNKIRNLLEKCEEVIAD